MSRRRLTVLAAVLAVLLVAGADVWVARHFGENAATYSYPDDYLSAVACPAAARCWAVGQIASAPNGSTLGERRGPLLMREAAGRWQAVALSARAALEAIACPGPADCWVVGGNGARGTAVIEHWARGAWQQVASPVVQGSRLDAVSCASVRACWATGGTLARSGAAGDLLEQWDGARWSVAGTIAGGMRPQQFSCPAPGFCLALGLRDGEAAAAAYSAGHWSATTPPPPGRPGGAVPPLFGCASPVMCLTVFPGSDPVTDVWNGRAWTPVASSGMLAYPAGLACAGRRGCWLLGMTGKDQPRALRWQGAGWTTVAVPAVPGRGYLTGLACASICWAVGGQGGTRRTGAAYTGPLITRLSWPAAWP